MSLYSTTLVCENSMCKFLFTFTELHSGLLLISDKVHVELSYELQWTGCDELHMRVVQLASRQSERKVHTGEAHAIDIYGYHSHPFHHRQNLLSECKRYLCTQQ